MVEVVESPPRGMESPLAEVADEPQVEEAMEGGSSKETRKEVFDSVYKMTQDRLDKVHQNKKYIKASSSFLSYNFGKAFS